MKNLFNILFALLMVLPAAIPAQGVRTADGRGNNFNHPEWGGSNTPLRWEAHANYSDGVSEPAGTGRPNARAVSNSLFFSSGLSHLDPQQHSAYVWVFAQFLENEISLVPDNPTEPFPIPVPAGDAYFDPENTGSKVIPFFRGQEAPHTGTDPLNPRLVINAVTTWLDGSTIYGSTEASARWLRTFHGGKLKTSAGQMLPFNTLSGEFADTIDFSTPHMDARNHFSTRVFVAGDCRANENLMLTALHTIFLREHNRLCDQFAALYPHWDDEQLYQHARRYVGALLQHITFDEWLPALGINLPPYERYNPQVNPTLSNACSAAAIKFWHSLANSDFVRLDNLGQSHPTSNSRLEAATFQPVSLLTEGGVSPLLKGVATQQQERMDVYLSDAVRNFSAPYQTSYIQDFGAINLQRGRERGLTDFNTLRKALGLRVYRQFSDINADKQLSQILEQLYGDLTQLDAWTGLVFESPQSDALFGETLLTLLHRQFLALRDGDRFYFENDPNISPDERFEIQATRLSDIVLRNTDIFMLQKNLFFAKAHADLVPLSKVNRNLEVFVYPNPCRTTIQYAIKVEEPGNAIMHLLDLSGRCIEEQKADLPAGLFVREMQLSSRLRSGEYIIQVEMEGKSGAAKVIKSRI
jgi:hypothetical protein